MLIEYVCRSQWVLNSRKRNTFSPDLCSKVYSGNKNDGVRGFFREKLSLNYTTIGGDGMKDTFLSIYQTLGEVNISNQHCQRVRLKFEIMRRDTCHVELVQVLRISESCVRV